MVPKICEAINSVEAHSTEQSRQGSLYIKVALFRWFNSAIAMTIVFGFLESITPDQDKSGTQTLPQTAYNVIYAELFTIPIIKLLDIVGFVKKHILAPRARDQEEMNAYFMGAKSDLAERYTDATKVLFVALFYSALLPQSLFLGAVALMIHFVVGKFCLLRTWRPSPDVGPGLSRLSRNYFFSLALLIHVIMSAYWWSGYPYDNVCENPEAANSNNGNGDDDGGNNPLYVSCNQDFLRNGIFPPLPRFQLKNSGGYEWMTESQEKITALYGWTALGMVVVGFLVFFKEVIYPFITSFFTNPYEVRSYDLTLIFLVYLSRLRFY